MERNSGYLQSARARRPPSKAARHHVADDRADIGLLGRRIIGSGVVTSHGQRPVALLGAERLQETGGVFDIARRVEHVAKRTEVGAMPVVVDLHAADVDELCAMPLRLSEARHRLGQTGGMNGFTVDVHVIGAKLAPAPGLR
jgi:hypothetical protein